MHRYISLIPARGGSKGIRKKNIVPLKGKPLIWYSISASLGVGSISHTFVSSEDPEIIDVAARCGAGIIRRPEALAQDATPTGDVVEDAIAQLAAEGIEYDAIVLLQPTSPLRNSIDIAKAIAVFEAATGQDKIVVSVFELSHSPYKAYGIDAKGRLAPLFDARYPNTRRQDLPRAYYPNGAIYVILREYFAAKKILYSENMYPFIMESERSVDIDTIGDIRRAELAMDGDARR